MATCTACGSDVTGMKFCQQCGSPVATSTSQGTFCPNCGQQAQPGTKFCSNCGSSLNAGSPVVQPTYPPPPQPATQQPYQSQYGQPQYGQPQYAQQSPYPQQPQYTPYPPQAGYQQQPGYPTPNQAGYQQPMMGQAPMVLRCPTCMAMAPVGTAFCSGCNTNLAGVVPTPMPVQGQQQQGGLGGLFQGPNGKMAMGALGGAAAVIGGEMLLGGLENRMDGGYGYGHRREEGPLGELGDLGRDIGLL